MASFFLRLIETAIGASVQSPVVVVLPEDAKSDNHPEATSIYPPLTQEMSTETCRIHVLPANDLYLDYLRRFVTENKAQRLFVLPLLGPHRHLSQKLRTNFSGLNYEQIVLQVALEHLEPGTTLGIMLPSSFFSLQSTRNFRARLFEQAPPQLLLTHGLPLSEIGFRVHACFLLSTLILAKEPDLRVLRLFKCGAISDPSLEDDVLADLARLLKQGGGTTKYGYILREGLPFDAPLMHDLYAPAFLSKQRSIQEIGQLRPLSEVVEVRLGSSLARNAHCIVKNASEGIPVIEGRSIRTDGVIDVEDVRYREQSAANGLLRLQEGDLCIRRIGASSQRLCIAEVKRHLLPVAAGDSVIVLRFKDGLSLEEREVLAAYLRSGHFSEQVNVRRGASVSLAAAELLGLSVPIPDKTLIVALSEINDAISRFRRWSEEAERARDALFEFTKPREDAAELYAVGRLSRQRCEGASLVSDLGHRIRTQFPHPLAFRWRTTEASRPDLEGIQNALECTEVAACYVACLGLLMARATSGVAVRYVAEIGKRMNAPRPHGLSLGDWVAIIRELRESRAIRMNEASTPFFEVATIDDETNAALQRLFNSRNDIAHGRGPKGAQVKPFFEDCRVNLEAFLGGIEFLTEYPLRWIEKAVWDSILRRTTYQYRQFMGDHPMVPVCDGRTDSPDIEEGSLYVVDRGGRLHLFRPLLNLIDCPECGRPSMFCLDRYSKADNECLLKSMEHGHTARADESTVVGLRNVGLLPPP